uniref:Uncharacterized protein n=1 Tax=Solanum lycopersicum TaxID=4081 RepID=A0A3Q7HX80_SOLLC
MNCFREHILIPYSREFSMDVTKEYIQQVYCPSIGVIEPSANEGRRQNEEKTQRETIHVEQFELKIVNDCNSMVSYVAGRTQHYVPTPIYYLLT